MSVRRSVATDLRDARAAILRAENRLASRVDEWPDGDLTPHELAEARELLSGIRARLAFEIVRLELPTVAPAKASA